MILQVITGYHCDYSDFSELKYARALKMRDNAAREKIIRMSTVAYKYSVLARNRRIYRRLY